MTAAEQRRLDRIRQLARQELRAEAALDRALARAAKAGYSTRTLEKASGIPRATIWRRIGRFERETERKVPK